MNRLIIAVISIAPYLTDKGGHIALYKINNNVYIKTSKIINYVVIILYSSHARAQTDTHTRTHARTHAQSHTHTHTCAHARGHTEGM